MTRRGDSLHRCPRLPPRSCFGTRPARPWHSASSKHTAAGLLWCMARRGDSLHRCPKLLPRACFGTRPARPWPSASSKPTAASLLWYTAGAALACGIIQTHCRALTLVHGKTRRQPSPLPKTPAASLPWCRTRRGDRLHHCPKLPPRACFGTQPARPWPSTSSKHAAAGLPWCRTRRGDNPHHCPKLPPRACFGTRPARPWPAASSKHTAARLP